MTKKNALKTTGWFLLVFLAVNLLFVLITFLTSYDKKEEIDESPQCALALGAPCKDRRYYTEFSLGLPLIFFNYENSGYGITTFPLGDTPGSTKYVNDKNEKDLDLTLMLQSLAINALVIGGLVYIIYRLRSKHENSRN